MDDKLLQVVAEKVYEYRQTGVGLESVAKSLIEMCSASRLTHDDIVNRDFARQRSELFWQSGSPSEVDLLCIAVFRHIRTGKVSHVIVTGVSGGAFDITHSEDIGLKLACDRVEAFTRIEL